MSLDDDIKQALHRHEGDVQQPARAWNDIERSVRRGHRVRSAAISFGAAAAIAAVAMVVPQLSSKQNPAPTLSGPSSETPSSSASPSTPPLTPTLLAKIGVHASKLAAIGDSIWALDANDNTLVRINGSTNDVTARIDVGPNAVALAVAPDYVWVASDTRLAAVDPAKNKIVSTFAVSQPLGLSAELGTVWVVEANDGTPQLVRLDLSAGRASSASYALTAATGPASIALGDGYVWIAQTPDSTPDGKWYLERFDPASETFKKMTIEHFASPRVGVATTPGAVWVSTTGTTSASALDRFDPATMQLVARFELPDASPVGGPNAITTGEGYLWAVGERGQFWKVDITKNEPVGDPLSVGEAPPINAPDVVTGFGSVWIATDDGHIWRYAP